MKIAITASGESPDSALDMRFGRAAYFIVFTLPEGTHEFFKNDCKLNAVQGAGIQAAEHVSNFGAEVLITGHCGPKAFKALSAAGIKIHCCDTECKVSEALEAFKTGKLKQMSTPDVEGHWV
jgi:predicted Fe-Mo cluster-binding NifX family protein